VSGHSFTPQSEWSTLCVCGEWDHHSIHGPNSDRRAAWQPMCGDLVVTPDGWTGRVVAQHGPYSWVSMQATNSPQTWGTSTLKPVDESDD